MSPRSIRSRRRSTPCQPDEIEVDEERQVVEARVPLGDQLLLEPLEPPDRVVEQPLDLAEVPRHGKHLAAQALLHRLADPLRQRRLERERRGAERLDLLARAPERRLEPPFLVPALACLRDALLRPFQCLFIHGRKATLAVG